MVDITFHSVVLPASGALVLSVVKGGKLGLLGQKLDQKIGGMLKKAISSAAFEGGKGKTLSVYAPANTRLSRIILVGAGNAADLTENVLHSVGGAVFVALKAGKEETASLWTDLPKESPFDADVAAAHIGYGLKLKSYRFDDYRTVKKDEGKVSLKKLVLMGREAALKKAYHPLAKVADGVFMTRDLVTMPSNILYPETLADEARKLEAIGVKVSVLDEKAMAKLGMGALLGVAQGSRRPPRLVTLSWNGNPTAKDKRPVAFVGKGVTFDSGGISLKPGQGMWDMKYDMAGSAVVLGAVKALALRKAKVNVVGVIGLVENMPDGDAQRPGDVVTSMSKQTIEVLNTDAEGRLVLADAVWYTQEKFKPSVLIDLATLTGAIRIALGTEYAGLFSNNDTLTEQLLASGKSVEEKLWAMPLNDVYDKGIDSPIADVKNIGDPSLGAGSSSGAHFVKRFIKPETAWAHLDIASVSWTNTDKDVCPKGATAFGVRLLENYIATVFEQA